MSFWGENDSQNRGVTMTTGVLYDPLIEAIGVLGALAFLAIWFRVPFRAKAGRFFELRVGPKDHRPKNRRRRPRRL
jgi:hypothetical protein